MVSPRPTPSYPAPPLPGPVAGTLWTTQPCGCGGWGTQTPTEPSTPTRTTHSEILILILSTARGGEQWLCCAPLVPE